MVQQHRSMPGNPQPPPPLLPHQVGVEGGSAGPAGCQPPHLSSSSPPSYASPSWASMVQGNVRSRVEEHASLRQPPAVTTADFTSLYERCDTGGLKARITLSYISGRQIINLSCSLPAPNKAVNAPAERGCRHWRRQDPTATATVDKNSTTAGDNVPPPPPPPLTPLPPTTHPQTPTPTPPSPPAKRKRKRQNELELLQDWGRRENSFSSPCPARPHHPRLRRPHPLQRLGILHHPHHHRPQHHCRRHPCRLPHLRRQPHHLLRHHLLCEQLQYNRD
jgi:hypothetical protein